MKQQMNDHHHRQATSLRCLPWMAVLLVVLTSLVTACIKNADDDGQPTPPAPDTAFVIVDSTKVVIDSSFRATAAYMQREWMAVQYQGYDPMQNKISAIRRLVVFMADGSYESHVQGIVDISDTTVTEYKEFEHEMGTYALDVERQLMTYTVQYDSVLNFGSDLMEYHPGKFRGMSIEPSYTEQLRFSEEREGRRDWIRTDDNLLSTTDHQSILLYIMKSEQ